MNITTFNASPWGQEGHTQVIVREFLAGAHNAGAKVRNILLVQKQINVCTGCGVCFYETPGQCVFKDDMGGLIKTFLACDLAILATPVYIDNVTTLMKTFIDRLMPILEPHYEKDPNGEYRRRARYRKYPRLMVISSCAMPEQTHFQVLHLFFKRMARTMHTEVAAAIYRSAAGLLLLSRDELWLKPAVKEYKKLLNEAGQEFVKTGRISPETDKRLHEPLINADEYVEYANTMWDQIVPGRSSRALV
jgi:multimeric flavodoxin WrbA